MVLSFIPGDETWEAEEGIRKMSTSRRMSRKSTMSSFAHLDDAAGLGDNQSDSIDTGHASDLHQHQGDYMKGMNLHSAALNAQAIDHHHHHHHHHTTTNTNSHGDNGSKVGIREWTDHRRQEGEDEGHRKQAPMSYLRFSCFMYNSLVVSLYATPAFSFAIYFTWDEETVDLPDSFPQLYLVMAVVGLSMICCLGCGLWFRSWSFLQDPDDHRYFCPCACWPFSYFQKPMDLESGGTFRTADPLLWGKYSILSAFLLASALTLLVQLPLLAFNILWLQAIWKAEDLDDTAGTQTALAYTFVAWNVVSLVMTLFFLWKYTCCHMTARTITGREVALRGLYLTHDGSVPIQSMSSLRNGSDLYERLNS